MSRFVPVGLLLLLAVGCSQAPESASVPAGPAAANPAGAEAAPAASLPSPDQVTNKLAEPAFVSVDGINGKASPASGSVIPVSGEKLEVAGFAIDDVNKDAAGAVLVMIDDKPVLAVYGGERPDIAKTLNNPNYEHTQFYAAVPLATLAKGTHEVSVRVLPKDMKGYHQSEWSAKIEVQ